MRSIHCPTLPPTLPYQAASQLTGASVSGGECISFRHKLGVCGFPYHVAMVKKAADSQCNREILRFDVTLGELHQKGIATEHEQTLINVIHIA